MEPERWRQVEQLFHAALEREESQRAAFLAVACQGDEALRREVESLLVCQQQAENFMETPKAYRSCAILEAFQLFDDHLGDSVKDACVTIKKDFAR